MSRRWSSTSPPTERDHRPATRGLPGSRPRGQRPGRYGSARSLDGLTADPAWLDEYADPPAEAVAAQVSQWLADQGARTDLRLPAMLEELSGLRSRNASALDRVVHAADTRVRAWARARGTAVPAGWNAPVVAARAALERPSWRTSSKWATMNSSA